MIEPDEIKTGNWICISHLHGILVDVHRVLAVLPFGVCIKNGKTYKLTKTGNTWEYPEVPRKVLLDFGVIEGIPLTLALVENCGFKVDHKPTLTLQSDKGKSIIKYYSDQHLFTLNYKPGVPDTFTHESHHTNIEFVHQLQNVYEKYMHKELEITINPFNYQLLSF